MQVETKNASLDTMAVTIRALHVSGKQMTLAVFRQLPVAKAYNDDGTLWRELEHWGIVRYDIKDAGCVWVVASRSGILYRCNTNHGLDSPKAVQRQVEYARERIVYFEAKRKAAEQYKDWIKKYQALSRRFELEYGTQENTPGSSLDYWKRKEDFITNNMGPSPKETDSFLDRDRERLEQFKCDVPRLLVACGQATNAEQSHATLMFLQQLFIAV